MKKLVLSLASAALSLSLVACSTTSTAPAQTPAQVAAQVCPLVQPTLATLSAMTFDPKTVAELAVASTAVNVVCAAGAMVTTTNLQAMANSALPAIVTAVKASTLPAAQQNAVTLDLTLANSLVNTLIVASGQTVKPAASIAR